MHSLKCYDKKKSNHVIFRDFLKRYIEYITAKYIILYFFRLRKMGLLYDHNFTINHFLINHLAVS